jgi:hypothetical protein
MDHQGHTTMYEAKSISPQPQLWNFHVSPLMTEQLKDRFGEEIDRYQEIDNRDFSSLPVS